MHCFVPNKYFKAINIELEGVFYFEKNQVNMHFIKKAEKRNKERSKMHRWLECNVPPVAIGQDSSDTFWFAGSSEGKIGSLLPYVSAW